VFLGLICSGLLLHNAYGLRLADLVAREGAGAIFQLTGSRLAIAVAVIAVAFLALATVPPLRRHRTSFSKSLPPAVARLIPLASFVLALVPGLLLGRLNAPYLPLQWSLAAAPALGLIGVSVATVSRARSLLLMIGLVAAAVIGAFLRWGPNAETRARLDRLESAATAAREELRSLRGRLQTVDPADVSAQSFLPVGWADPELARLDATLSRILIEDARPPDPEQGILARIPDGHDLIPWRDLEERDVERGPQGYRIAAYSGGGVLRTQPALGIPSPEVRSIRIRMRVSAGRTFAIYWNEGDTFDRRAGIRIPLSETAEPFTYEIREPLSGISLTHDVETIDHLYIVPSDRNAEVEIEWIEICDELGALGRSSPVAVEHHNLQGETRHTLALRYGTRLRIPVLVPAHSPRLQFGLARGQSTAAAELRISIEDGQSRANLLAERVDRSSGWQDREIPLAAHAGKTCELFLEVESTGEGILRLSNPILIGQPHPMPNVVIYLVDCLRGDHDGRDRHQASLTPHMDAFAAEGVRFLRAYSNGCTTKLSVPSLMSSNPIAATGVRQAAGMSVLPAVFVTLPEALRAAGYATAAVTANSNLGTYSGTHQGFSWIYDQVVSHGERRAHRASDPDLDGAHIVDTALDWLARHRQRRFFLYVHTLDSHGPYDPPAAFRKHFDALVGGTPAARDTVRLDPRWVDHPTAEGRRILYDGTVQYSDELFGRFLDGLRQLGLSGETLVILTSDHGEYFGEHGLWTHRPPPFVQGTHIPLIVRWPEGIPAGLRIEDHVQLMDIMPTVLQTTGLNHESPVLQGRSLLPMIRDRATEAFADRPVFVEGDFRASVHIGRFHYMGGRNVLYDLQSDPQEIRALSPLGLAFGAKAALRRLIDEYQRTYSLFHHRMRRAGNDQGVLSPHSLDQLRALGYIE
jgi:arylsulfatase A-like enzyme